MYVLGEEVFLEKNRADVCFYLYRQAGYYMQKLNHTQVGYNYVALFIASCMKHI